MKKIGNREWKVNAVVCIAYILKNPGNLRVVGIICYQIMTATLLLGMFFFSCKDFLGLV